MTGSFTFSPPPGPEWSDLKGYQYDVDSELLVELRAVACDAIDHAACYPVKNSFRVPLRLLRDAGQREVRVTLPLEVRR